MIFINNRAVETGGALYSEEGSPTIRRCVFLNNAAPLGGAANIEGPAEIADCLFLGNTADDPLYGGQGGGLSIWVEPSAAITNCIFHDCHAATEGGGIFVGPACHVHLLNCTLSDNQAPQGSGVMLEDYASITLKNTVIAFGVSGAAVSGTGQASASFSNVFNNGGGDWTGPLVDQSGVNGNINEDPLFVNHQDGDLHLHFDSPCRNSGDAAAQGLPSHDFESDPRIAHGAADMGADEFHSHLYYTGSAVPGGSVEVKLVGWPASTPVGLFLGSGMLDTPLQTSWGPFHLASPWVLFVLFPIPAGGVMMLPGSIPSTPPAPYELPLQSLIGNELTNPCIVRVR